METEQVILLIAIFATAAFVIGRTIALRNERRRRKQAESRAQFLEKKSGCRKKGTPTADYGNAVKCGVDPVSAYRKHCRELEHP